MTSLEAEKFIQDAIDQNPDSDKMRLTELVIAKAEEEKVLLQLPQDAISRMIAGKLGPSSRAREANYQIDEKIDKMRHRLNRIRTSRSQLDDED